MRILQFCLILALTSGFIVIIIYLTGLSDHYENHQLLSEDWEALQSLQSGFQKCVSANGLGLKAIAGKDYCQVTLSYPSDTDSKWRDPKTGELEGLSFEFNLCEAVATWEQVRNSTTILTREFIDALPNGWEEYAWQRINKGVLLNHCKNKALYMEKLSLVLPETPPYVPRQFGRCAVIGNSGDLLKTRRVGAGSEDLLSSCSIIKKQVKRKHMSVSRLRKAAADHQKFVKGTTMYSLEHNAGHG